ncbi:6-hydroxymethylpterin diphosphokinase MptE-like protein [Sporosarcina sp. FSL K6-5500]|uniref:6-hydroxymethylpterin diphosphokinase MptE-like protein n=1 Tax=Sporosarcina sp. FSL K6-5500 TaxID=2921558 RepID=UPI0030FACECD
MNFKENAKRIETKLQPFIQQLEQQLGNVDFQNYLLVDTRMGVPTLEIEQEGKNVFLHSKYNPIQESEKVAKDYENSIADKEHIIFFGVGLGYHIEEIMSQYPEKKFTLIETNPTIFVRFLESRSLNKFPFNQMSSLYIHSEEVSLGNFLTLLSLQLKGNASVVVFPAYERLFEKEVNQFYKDYREALKVIQSSVVATGAFGKRWVLNSLMNVPTTLSTQNIKEKAIYFRGKPVIIVSAGPSLYEDLSQLKHIKDNGLAYLFAVGSANKALLSYDITPDAVLTYDPQPRNVKVFKELIASGRTDIPMIYGTSVGFETIEVYQGPKFHLVNSSDSVTNYYLNKQANEYDVYDSTTIALIAIQVAELLEAEIILLAGQNLAFKENRYYAEGIEHGQWKGQVREDKEGQVIQTTKDVYGNLIDTNASLINMKKDIEFHLEMNSQIQVINTTKGGAAIKGAPFEPIEQVIKERLKSAKVNENWFVSEQKDPTDNTVKQVLKLELSIDKMYALFDACRTILQRLDGLKRTDKAQKINKLFIDFDKQFDRLIKNDFYSCFIASILQREFEQLNKTIRKSYVEEQVKKIDIITSSNMLYLRMVQETFSEMVVHVKETMHPKLLEQSTDWKVYKHNDGVFHYEGDWECETMTFDDFSSGKAIREINKTISTMSKTSASKVSFRFQGTKLQLLAATHADFASKIKITIDGIERMFTTKNRQIKNGTPPNLHQTVFEINALSNTIHDVSIVLTTDEKIAFQGIKINPDGRIYHVDEVTSVDELEVGKRIRCHIPNVVNDEMVPIINIGEETVHPMSFQTTFRNTDFFLIKVFEEHSGNSKFVCNKNLGISQVDLMINQVRKRITLNVIPLMEANESANGRASCSSYHVNHNNCWSANKAFNKKTTGLVNAWATEKGITHGWIGFEFTSPTILNSYTMVNQERYGNVDTLKRMPKDWVFQGWNGENWIVLDERTEVTDWINNRKKHFTISNEIAYKEYRISISSNNGDPEFLAIGEIEMF